MQSKATCAIGWTWRPLLLLCGFLFVGLMFIQWIGLQHLEKHARPKDDSCVNFILLVTNQDCILIIQIISFPNMLYKLKLRWHFGIEYRCQLTLLLFFKTSYDTLDLKLNIKWNLSNIDTDTCSWVLTGTRLTFVSKAPPLFTFFVKLENLPTIYVWNSIILELQVLSTSDWHIESVDLQKTIDIWKWKPLFLIQTHLMVSMDSSQSLLSSQICLCEQMMSMMSPHLPVLKKCEGRLIGERWQQGPPKAV